MGLEKHDQVIPKDKIITRYHRLLALLFEAVQVSHRACIFDNSGHGQVWLAEITDGYEMKIKSETFPHWFKSALWDKFAQNEGMGL